MNKLIAPGAVLAAALCLVCVRAAAQERGQQEWKQVTMKGEVYYAMPNEVARSLGLPREDIPDDENAATYYMQAANALPEEPEDPAFQQQYSAALKAPWDPEQNRELYAWFQTTAEARRLFKQAASMDRCQFPVLTAKPGDRFLAAVMMPPLSGIRQLARLMTIEGHLLEQQGKMREALEAYLAAFRTGGHLGRERSLITGLVGIACQAIGCGAMRDCLARHDIQKDVLEWLAGALGELEKSLPDRSAWIAGERAMAVQVTQMAPDEWRGLFGPQPDLPRQERAFLRSRAFRILWPDRTIRKDFDAFYDRIEGVTKESPWEAVATLRQHPAERLMAEHAKDWNVLASMLLPTVDTVQVVYARGICDHAGLRMNVALRLYRADHAAYPDTLDALAPDYLAALPTDPFSGQPFHYRREADGWILYSVGPDQDDDGGREADRGRGQEDGDLVYRSHLTEGTE